MRHASSPPAPCPASPQRGRESHAQDQDRAWRQLVNGMVPAMPRHLPRGWRGGHAPWGASCWILHEGGEWPQPGQEGSAAFGEVAVERRGWTGRVAGVHKLVPFPVLYLIIGGDCPPKLTALNTTGS